MFFKLYLCDVAVPPTKGYNAFILVSNPFEINPKSKVFKAPKIVVSVIPVAVAKDSDLLVTQFEGKVIEDAGVIKMDFLGLKNLTILKNTLRFIKENHDIQINLEDIPLDDQKTYELLESSETSGLFQLESSGMRASLRKLKPNQFEDLIAILALYRPGPMENIDEYIKRRNGKHKTIFRFYKKISI